MKYRPLWIAAGALVGLFAMALVGVNIYLQSEGTQARLKEILRDATGLPIEIGRTSYLPWRGVVCSKIRLDPDEVGPNDADLLRADTLRLRAGVFSLFSRSIRIRELVLENPTIVLTHSPSGGMAIPLPPAVKQADATTAPTQSAPPPESPTQATVPSEAPEPGKESEPLTLTVDSSVLTGGNMLIRDEQKRALAEIQGIEIRCGESSLDHVEGDIAIARAVLSGKLEFTNVRSRFAYNNGEFALPDLVANLAGGTAEGSFRFSPEGDGRPYSTTLELGDISLEQVIEQFGGPQGRANGHFDGFATLSGSFDDPAAAAGEGELRLISGAIEQGQFLQQLGKVLKIRELEKLEFKQASTRFKVVTGDLMLEELMLGSDNLELVASGVVRSDASMSLDASLLLERKVTKRLPDLAKENMRDVPGREGYRALDFRIGGTLAEPETDLMERLVGKRLEDKVTDALFQILGGKRKKKDETP